jgi:hypothetical protein
MPLNNTCNVSAAAVRQQVQLQQSLQKIIDTAQTAIECGPDCEKQKEEDRLKQLYLDAQTNILTAPNSLTDAEKNYFVYSKGEQGYRDILYKRYKAEAEQLVILLKTNYTEQGSLAMTVEENYKSTIIGLINAQELYEEINNKNKDLAESLNISYNDFVTNNRKGFYESAAQDVVNVWYNIWWYSYYTILVILLITIFRYRSDLKFSKYYNIFIVLVLLTYPYFMPYLMGWIIETYLHIKSQIPVNIYRTL